MIAFVPAILLPTILSFQGTKAAPFQERLSEAAKTYGIEILHEAPIFPARTSWGVIEGKKAAGKSLERYTPLFLREITLLPTTLIAKAKLKKVVLCEELSFAGQRR